ncbi:MAG TPA: hypothetical protein PKC18_01645 [Lacipirellulaceae bacterium]|nr:hypothetical protein [Lacipirellulaceae bacterium]HMP04723.1 hypothetical protein [Lacipirellulaceae bacterium]
MRRGEYKYETTSVTGFVQRIATCLLRHGYVHYVQGEVPEGKDPRAIDRKLLAKYEVDQNEWTRARRKERGLANLQYVRYERTWVLMATEGFHPMKTEERSQLRDVREAPVQIAGYSIYLKRGDLKKKRSKDEAPVRDDKWHARVLISRERYKELRAWLLDIACHRSAEGLAMEINSLPFEPYKPVWRQLRKLVRLVNKKRKAAGYSLVPMTAVRWRRTIVKAFEPVEVEYAA